MGYTKVFCGGGPWGWRYLLFDLCSLLIDRSLSSTVCPRKLSLLTLFRRILNAARYHGMVGCFRAHHRQVFACQSHRVDINTRHDFLPKYVLRKKRRSNVRYYSTSSRCAWPHAPRTFDTYRGVKWETSTSDTGWVRNWPTQQTSKTRGCKVQINDT